MSSIARRIAFMQWTPHRLGSGLYAAWDPEEPASYAPLSGGAVSTWRDYLNGYAPTQGIGASRPAFGFSPFNGRPIITPDGVDDQLTLTGIPAGIPTGATPFEVWIIWNQIAVAGVDVGSRWGIGWGGTTAASTTFAFGRSVISGVNRATLFIGTGSTVQASNLNVDFSGRRVIRGILDGTTARVDVDGNVGTPVAAVPTIANTVRLRLFANALNTVGGFASGDFSGIFLTRLQASDEAAKMYDYCNKRIV